MPRKERVEKKIGKELQNAAKGCESVTSFLVTLQIALHLHLGHSKLISCSMGPTDHNFRENKKILLISSQNKK